MLTLNVLVGPNNAGKTAVVDALRVLLSAGDEGALRVSSYDLHVTDAGAQSAQATFSYVFAGLSKSEEADFLTALKPTTNAKGETEYEAHLTVRYSNPDDSGRLRVRRWCGDHEDNPIASEMLEDLRAVYLPPLRDPAQGLRPSRSSQLARLVQRLSDDASRQEVVETLTKLDTELRAKKPITDTQAAITKRHTDMLGKVLSQKLAVGLSPSDFQRVAARLALAVADFDVEQNGLGFNNLIYMAVVLSELSLNKEAAYRALIVEEPEAHLHPQLQAVLLQYLKSVETPAVNENPVQVFVTSHSPNFAALADIDSISCIYEASEAVGCLAPREIAFEKRKKEKLQRYLNVTRAEIFFARRIILVEGTAELFLVEAMAHKLGIDLRKHSVSVISTDGLNFDAFLPLFGETALKVPVAVVTDGDPTGIYPQPGEHHEPSATAKSIQAQSDTFVRPFLAAKTLEYDLAMTATNRATMLEALKDLHPGIAKDLAADVEAAKDEDKAKVLFKGMFERGEGKANVQKGAYGQALAQAIVSDGLDIEVPDYLADALNFITAE
ncbi:MAG: AAA family ATPase [Ralstonia sp.]|uniref:AAA family ATPase n=4 Tax=Pseudomonadota TaxID=1224 RepID=A0AAW4Q3Z4_RALPI|nr:AAA family ATPase [Ralstonia pickettii]MBX3754284.1 AAA family ATPase [Ralstonia pickettii]MBX3768038.1 AAA family ATPase [Ralstonia pickettii]MBX3777812.1 AAA family ATPase [Ralstonia pickettii]MBX3783065.1 AAA family ATPase [Ralstonia pickettii]MBX3790611.1 AAA family ATPase [Ralstonia pickettii]